MRRTTTLAVMCVLLAGGCDSGGSDSLNTIAPTSARIGTLPFLPETSDGSTTSIATEATVPEGVIGLSNDGPWKLVDSAPGITTPGLVYELMPGLWAYLPVVEDVPNGITWTLNEEDRPIIEAYLQAKLVYFESVTANPINLDHAGWTEWFADGGASLRDGLLARRDEGQHVDLDVGVVLRPHVIGDDRTESSGIVFDCVLDGGFFVLPDGTLADGSSIGVVESGSAYRLERAVEHWIVVETGRQRSACD